MHWCFVVSSLGAVSMPERFDHLKLAATAGGELLTSHKAPLKVALLHPAIGEFAFPVGPELHVFIGRTGTDLELPWDRRISRRHAHLWVDRGQIWFEDLNSKNGSWRGSERLKGPVRLQPGTTITLGETILMLKEVRDEAPRAVEQTYEVPLSAIPPRLPPPAATTETALPSATVSEVPLAEPSRTSDVLRTMDLLTSDDLLPAADDGGPPPLANLHGTRLNISVTDRSALRALWVRDLSKGALYVTVPEPAVLGARLEVVLDTPGGSFALHGRTVHVAANAMGVELEDLVGDKRRLLQDYVDGLTHSLVARAKEEPQLDPVAAAALERMRWLMTKAEDEDYYGALEVPSTVAPRDLELRVEELRKQLREAIPRLPPPQAARIETALSILDRVRRVLSSPEVRLEYDFRRGHVRADERLTQSASGRGPTLSVLRQTWNRVHPDRVERAAALTRKAFAARQSHDLPAAIRAGRQALELNPFFDEMRKTVRAWEELLQRDQG